jgi:hypothetical protein
MSAIEIIDKLPLWGVFLISIAIILLSLEFGFQIGRRERGRSSDSGKIQTGPVVAASLGLLAFILAFTFGAVTSRFDERKQLVLDEANAIGTTYLRADVLPANDRAMVQQLLLDYVTLRIDVAQAVQIERLGELQGKSEEIQRELWSRAVDITEQQPTPSTGLFMQSVNDVIDLHQMRLTVLQYHRMPVIFWVALYGLTVVAMVVGGYDSGLTGGRRSVTTVMSLALAFSVVLILVVALDRPGQQLSKVTQAALVDVQKQMRRSTY